MRLISWNVNGFRAALRNGFAGAFSALDADIFCLQETKMQPGQAEFDPEGYHQWFNSAEKKGYSGTAVFSRPQPTGERFGIGPAQHSTEGRAITLEYPEFNLVNLYTPNAQPELRRIGYRLEWERDLCDYLVALDKKKPVIICGDLNVAHEEIDLKNPGPNRGNPGFSDEEREAFTKLLAAGFTDTFRAQHPDTVAYSWWSYRGNARANNTGWRIDYFLVSNRLMDRVKDSFICPEVMGSDHCPVGIELAV